MTCSSFAELFACIVATILLMLLMMTANTDAPINMIRVTKIRSPSDPAEMSPYPTVHNVHIKKYTATIYVERIGVRIFSASLNSSRVS